MPESSLIWAFFLDGGGPGYLRSLRFSLARPRYSGFETTTQNRTRAIAHPLKIDLKKRGQLRTATQELREGSVPGAHNV